jgi:D-glycero-D-manno-heptose 1,7-bisphosphate phosphatase
VRVPDAARYGCVTIDAAGLVRQFREKCPGIGPAVISAGIYWFDRGLLAAGTASFPCSLERDVLPTLLDGRLAADQVEAAFLDIGVPEAYAGAAEFFTQCQLRKRRDRKKLLVVDRDGTLIAERHYLANPREVELLPGVIDGLRAFAQHGYDLAIVTNQSGIGRGFFDETTLSAIHAELRRQLGLAGITIHGIWHCPHRPDEGCECRKPAPQLLDHAMQELGYTPQQCLVVGDKACDIELGGRLGVRTALVRTGYGAGTERDGLCSPDLIVDGLAELALHEVGR